jgi:hypothetical protein
MSIHYDDQLKLKKRALQRFGTYDVKEEKDPKQLLKFKIRKMCADLYIDVVSSGYVRDYKLASDALEDLFNAKNRLVESIFVEPGERD